jgi:hypothetical protein
VVVWCGADVDVDVDKRRAESAVYPGFASCWIQWSDPELDHFLHICMSRINPFDAALGHNGDIHCALTTT